MANNFTGYNSNQTPGADYSLENDQVERRRKIAELLRSQMGGNQRGSFISNPAGTFYVPSSDEGWAGFGKKLGGALLARRADKKTDAMEQDVRSRQQAEASQWMQDLPNVDRPSDLQPVSINQDILNSPVTSAANRQAGAVINADAQQMRAEEAKQLEAQKMAHLARGSSGVLGQPVQAVASNVLAQTVAPRTYNTIDLGDRVQRIDERTGEVAGEYQKGESEAARLAREDRAAQAATTADFRQQQLEQQRLQDEENARIRQEQLELRRSQQVAAADAAGIGEDGRVTIMRQDRVGNRLPPANVVNEYRQIEDNGRIASKLLGLFTPAEGQDESAVETAARNAPSSTLGNWWADVSGITDWTKTDSRRAREQLDLAVNQGVSLAAQIDPRAKGAPSNADIKGIKETLSDPNASPEVKIQSLNRLRDMAQGMVNDRDAGLALLDDESLRHLAARGIGGDFAAPSQQQNNDPLSVLSPEQRAKYGL